VSDKDKPGPGVPPEELLERYGRKGGSARRDTKSSKAVPAAKVDAGPSPAPTKGRFWQRMVDWVAPVTGPADEPSDEPQDDAQAYAPDELGDEPAAAPPAPPPPPPRAPAPQPAAQRAPAAPPAPPPAAPAAPMPAPAARSGQRRVAVELVLPEGQRLLVLARTAGDPSSGVLELQVEPSPANAPRVLAALRSASHGADELEEPPPPEPFEELEPDAVELAPPRPAAPRPPAAAPPPAAPARHAQAGAPAQSTTEPGLPVVRPPMGAATDPDLESESITLGPAPAQPTSQSSDFQLPDPTVSRGLARPARTTAGALGEPSPEPARAPKPPTGPVAIKGPARGGAARALYTDTEEEPTPADFAPRAPSPLDDLPGSLPAMREPPPREGRPDTQESRPLGQRPPRPTQPTPAVPPPPDPDRSPVRPVPREEGRAPVGPSAEAWSEVDDDGWVPPPSIGEVNAEILEQRPPPETMMVSPPPQADPRRRYLPIVGIDFGTTYSSISVMRAGLEVIPDEHGEQQMPSVVSFPEPGQVLVGSEARARMAGAAQWTIASPKRLLGRLYKDPQVTQLIGGLAFRTFAGSDKFIRFEAHGELYSVTDICAMILGKLRERACRFLDAEVSKAVFTVPVGFGTLQRSALELAARQAGLEVVNLLTEPSAAVLSHGFRGRRGLVAVYDFGGGTFDFCLLEVSETAFQVLCAGGDTWLGGDDFDNAMASHFADLFWNDTGVDLRTRAVEWQALIFACEKAKRELSSKKEAEVRCDDLLFTAKGKRGLRYKITRKEFVKLTRELVAKSIAIGQKVLSQAGVQPTKVDAVVLTGGTSLIPIVREAVTAFFKKKPVLGDPNLAVTKGAALRGAELGGEAVAGTSLGGRTLREVAGRTIGAGVQGGPVETLFERSTPVPAEVQRVFYTTLDGQTEMVIALYEESKSRIDESRTIGHLRYKGLRPARAGVGRVNFTFVLDEDGILHVSAIVEGKQYDKTIKLE